MCIRDSTESSEIDEGKVCFDIIFYVRMRDGLAKMIINLEGIYEPFIHHFTREQIEAHCRIVCGLFNWHGALHFQK